MTSRDQLASPSLIFAGSLCLIFSLGSAARPENLSAQSGKIIQLERAGKYAEALPLAQSMVSALEKGPPNRDLAGALNNLAQIYGGLGQDSVAEPIYKRALAIMEKAAGLDSIDMAPELTNLAALYQRQARYAEAEPLFKRALALRERALPPGHPDVGQSLNNLATLYERGDRHSESEPLFRRALAIYQKVPGAEPAVATLLNNLGQVLKAESRYADAEPPIRQSLAIREKVLGRDHIDVARSLNNLADLYLRQQRFADAEPIFQRALAIRDKAVGPDHPDAAASANNLASLYQAQGRTADALPLIDRVMAGGRAQLGVALAVLHDAQQKQLVPAEEAFDSALDVIQHGTQSTAAAAMNKLAVRIAAGSDHLAELVRRDQDLAGEAERLDKAIIASLSRQGTAQGSPRDAAKARDRLAAIAAERASLQKILARDFPDYAALSNPLPLKLREIQALLSADEAMVLFALADKESFVLALTHDRFDWKRIPLGAEALSQRVYMLRRGLDVGKASDSSGKSGLFDLVLANELYAALFGPVQGLVKDKPSLLVAPSGALTALPFHLLVTEKPLAAIPDRIEGYRDAAWLLKRQAVSVLPSISSLKVARGFAHRDQATKPMTGFGDPIFNPAEDRARRRTASRNVTNLAYTDFWQGAGVDRGRLAQALPQLPDTADELNAVGRDLGVAASDIHLGADASETTVKQAPLADYRIVYFATHGLVAGDIKGVAEPSLALSIPRTPSPLDDGLLTSSEVAGLKLNADFVVLSACNTIAGDKPGAEALSGLARAFFYAGARSLLVTHWSVDSEAATRLATATFDLLKAEPKLGRAEALRRAMLAYLADASSPRNAYPALWGPFALIGEGAANDPH